MDTKRAKRCIRNGKMEQNKYKLHQKEMAYRVGLVAVLALPISQNISVGAFTVARVIVIALLSILGSGAVSQLISAPLISCIHIARHTEVAAESISGRTLTIIVDVVPAILIGFGLSAIAPGITAKRIPFISVAVKTFVQGGSYDVSISTIAVAREGGIAPGCCIG